MRIIYFATRFFIFSLIVLVVSPNVSMSQGVVWRTVKKDIRNDFPEVNQLKVDTLANWIESEKDLLLLDARKLEEFEISHLKSAVQIDPDIESLPSWLDEELEKTIVVYCSVGYRSSKVASLLAEAGITDVYNLEGSIFEWANSGREVYLNEKRVHKVHPYNSLWGRLLDRQYRSF